MKAVNLNKNRNVWIPILIMIFQTFILPYTVFNPGGILDAFKTGDRSGILVNIVSAYPVLGVFIPLLVLSIILCLLPLSKKREAQIQLGIGLFGVLLFTVHN